MWINVFKKQEKRPRNLCAQYYPTIFLNCFVSLLIKYTVMIYLFYYAFFQFSCLLCSRVTLVEQSVCFRIAGEIAEKNTGKKLIENARHGPQKKYTLLHYRPVPVMSTFSASQRCPIGRIRILGLGLKPGNSRISLTCKLVPVQYRVYCHCLLELRLNMAVIDPAWDQDGWILAKFFFCVFMDRDEVEVHKHAKKERNGRKHQIFLAGQSPYPSGQDSSVLPALVANHNARFASCCPLTELVI